MSTGFAPLARPDARLLILGSLPSKRSLEKREYYAHPRNAFWPIMREITGADGGYAARCAALLDARIAVWDVLRQSVRPGSQDADIRLDTAEANDFGAFLAGHPGVAKICFNGRKAEAMFRRFVPLEALQYRPRLELLPSTSPAHASMPFAEKLRRWRRSITA